MSNLLEGLKTLIIGIAASAIVLPSSTPTPQATPLELNGDNYIYIQGKYSYLGQSVKYLFIVPKRGGGFDGAIEGVCKAQVAGNYEGGNGGKISGGASGKCNILSMKYQGSTLFNGNLYPDKKFMEVKVDNSPINPIKINYN